MDSILKLLADFQASISSLNAQLANAQAAQTAVQSAVDDAVKTATDPLNADIAAKAAQIEDLKAQLAAAQGGGTSGGFSQADVDAAVKAATDPLNSQIAQDQAQLASMQTIVDSIPGQIASAVEAFKAEVKAKVDADLGDLDGFLAPAPVVTPEPTPEVPTDSPAPEAPARRSRVAK